MIPRPRRGAAISFLNTNRRDALANSMTLADFAGPRRKAQVVEAASCSEKRYSTR